jgi:transposase
MRKPYPSDLTDAQWDIIRPLIPVNKVGSPRVVDMREVLNSILYLIHSGCQWDMQGHRTSSCTGSEDLRHEVIVPPGGAALDTRAGVLRPFLLHQIQRQPPQQRQVLRRVA